MANSPDKVTAWVVIIQEEVHFFYFALQSSPDLPTLNPMSQFPCAEGKSRYCFLDGWTMVACFSARTD